jgi:hypothetical protein
MTTITPLNDLGRIPEQGRIRLGVKTAKAMRSLDTFRFTSSDEDAICQIAVVYGGDVGEWMPPRSKQQQWEVITKSADIRVFLPPNSINVHYELWSGGGCQRRCDGVTALTPTKTPDGIEMDEEPCLCAIEGKQTCAPYTRLQVILPEIKFGGIWRLESKGWNAANEIPGMAKVLEQMQAVGLVEGRLLLEKRSKVSGGQTRHFVVPRLTTDCSAQEIMDGQARATSLEAPRIAELGPIVDAEIVEEGWDIPPPGISVVRNPNPPPKYVPKS